MGKGKPWLAPLLASSGAGVLTSLVDVKGDGMRTIGMLRGLMLAAVVSVLAATASADIKSFNAAMQVKDYKAAAAAAASTWPGLDKSRKDLAIIAREFGFAAYLAGDFAAAKMYGEAAVPASRASGEAPELQLASEILWRLADHRLTPDGARRGKLYDLLQARSAHASIDLITYASADAIAVYDFENGLWRDAMASTALGDKLTAGQPGYVEPNLRFQLLGAAARYMLERNTDAYVNLGAVRRNIYAAIAAAPSDADLRELEEISYEALAWSESMMSHLEANKRLRNEKRIEADWKAYTESPEYEAAASRTRKPLPEGVCPVSAKRLTALPDYPPSALFRGLIGTIILKLDVDEAGRAFNPRLVAAVPARHFADAALKGASKITYAPLDDSPAGCTMAQKDKILIIQFKMP